MSSTKKNGRSSAALPSQLIDQLVRLLNGDTQGLTPEEEAELTGVAPGTDEYIPPPSNIVDPWDESWLPPMPEIQHGSMVLPSAEESERAWREYQRWNRKRLKKAGVK